MLSYSGVSDPCDPMKHSPPGSSVHVIFQAGILEWVAISFSRGSSWSRDRTRVSCIADGFFTTAPPGKPFLRLKPTKTSSNMKLADHKELQGDWQTNNHKCVLGTIWCILQKNNLKIVAQKDDTGNCKLRTHIHIILILLPISTTEKVVKGLLIHPSYHATHHILNGICPLFRD